MNERRFLKKLNNEKNANGTFTFAYVTELLDSSNSVQTKSDNKIKELFNRLVHKKTRVDIIKDNFLEILYKTHPEHKKRLIERILKNPEFIDIIKKYFVNILKDLNSSAESRTGISTLITEYYDGSEERKKFIIENIDGIIKNTNKAVLIEILPRLKRISEEAETKINQELEKRKLEISKDLLFESISKEIKEEGIMDDIDVKDYSQTLSIIIDEILESENKRWVDIEKISNGAYSTVYRFGNKIIKIGDPRVSYKIKNHKRIIQPLLRTNLIGKYSKEVFGCIEVMDYVDTKFTNKEKRESEFVYQIYKELRDAGIIWTDPKWENVGKLVRPNMQTLNNEEMYVSPASVGFDKQNEDSLPIGEYVIIDIDFIFNVGDEEIYYGISEYHKYERRYKKERATKSTKTLTREQIKNLILELRTEENVNEVAIILNNLVNMSDEELKKLLARNKTIGELIKEIEGNLYYLEYGQHEKEKAKSNEAKEIK